MKKTLVLGVLLSAAAISLTAETHGHGGTYRGPGDTVPPGGGGGGGGGGPSTPGGPSGPAPPGPSGPSTGGGGNPTAPGTGPSRPTTPGGAGGVDLSQWQFWWGFNKAPYLNLREAVRTASPQTMGDDFFLGHGQKKPVETLAPSDAMVRERIVPALLRALDSERDNDIVTGCLVALARIGNEPTESGESAFAKRFMSFLPDGVAEISETAAICLGILGDPSSIGVLEELMFDRPRGRELVASANGVPEQTRAFAAYALGLIGSACEDPILRQRIVADLHSIVEAGRQRSRDVQVAALIATGLVPLDPAIDEGTPEKVDRLTPPVDLQQQVHWLLDFFESKDESRAPYLVRAHAPRALAQLLDGTKTDLLGLVRNTLVARLDRRGSGGQNVLRQSCALALGRLGDLDGDAGDIAVRRALMNGVGDPDQNVKSFCLIALAQLAERAGKGAKPDSGLGEVRTFLMRQLARGRSAGKSWAGLAIGVMERELADRGVPVSAASMRGLRESLEQATATREVGAYAIALGLVADTDAEKLILEKLDTLRDDEARGYLAVSLGLMRADGAKEAIQKLVEESRYRGVLLREAATALGLLGDKHVVTILTNMLENDAKALSTQAAIADALGFIGDRDAVEPLIAMLENAKISCKARAFAAVALGLVADRELLPWNSKISVDLNYLASTRTLTGEGRGVLYML